MAGIPLQELFDLAGVNFLKNDEDLDELLAATVEHANDLAFVDDDYDDDIPLSQCRGVDLLQDASVSTQSSGIDMLLSAATALENESKKSTPVAVKITPKEPASVEFICEIINISSSSSSSSSSEEVKKVCPKKTRKIIDRSRIKPRKLSYTDDEDESPKKSDDNGESLSKKMRFK